MESLEHHHAQQKIKLRDLPWGFEFHTHLHPKSLADEMLKVQGLFRWGGCARSAADTVVVPSRPGLRHVPGRAAGPARQGSRTAGGESCQRGIPALSGHRSTHGRFVSRKQRSPVLATKRIAQTSFFYVLMEEQIEKHCKMCWDFIFFTVLGNIQLLACFAAVFGASLCPILASPPFTAGHMLFVD